MRPFLLATVAVTLLGGTPARAADGNFNTQSSTTSNSTTANCQASFMLAGCAEAVAAPLPALGSGVLGAMLLSGAAGIGVLLRRRRGHDAG